MENKYTMKRNKSSRLWMGGVVAAVLIAGTLFTWWIAHRADRDMREGLLQQTRLVAQALNIERVRALSGTKADLDTQDYLRLKEQLAAIKKVEAKCRFVYLMGRLADGRVFFFADNEPVGSEDESPAGQIYEEISAEYLRAFDTGAELVEGPVTDRWGTWISALAPLIDPKTEKLIAMLGMDIDARTWNRDVAAHAALPVGLLLSLLIVVGTFLLSSVRRVDAKPKPVLRRLLPPLVAMVLLLAVGANVFVWYQYQRQQAAAIAGKLSEISGDLSAALQKDAAGLATALQPIVADERMHTALLAGDAERLLADWQPVFEAMHRDNNITHFYFFDQNRTCLLRVHKPEKHGDLINRFTALAAERTGKAASGIELGPLGAFTLRVVQPVFQGERLLGYVELGKEIENILQDLHERSGCHLAVAIRKEYLNRQTWEEGMRFLGREADWNRLPRSVIIYSSQGRLPDAFAPMADHDPDGGHAHKEIARIAFDGRDWGLSAIPLRDVSGKEVSDLLVMLDITAEKSAFARLLVLGGTAGVILLVSLVGFVFVLLRRTDAGIRAQQAELRESEEKHRLLTENAVSAIAVYEIVLDDARKPVDYIFLSANPAFETETGLRVADILGRRVTEVLPGIENTPFIEIYGKVVLIGEPVSFEQYSEALDRHYFINAYRLGEGRFATVFSDITARKRADEQLREKEALKHILLQNINAGIVIIDAVTHIIDLVNKKGVELFGGTEYQIVGNVCHCFLCPAKKGFCPVTDKGQDVDNSDRILLKADGSQLPILKSVRHIQIDGKDKLIETFIDISNRKQAEEKLKESETNFRTFFNSIDDFLFVLDEQSNMINVNETVTRRLEYPENELIGRNVVMVHPEERRAEVGRIVSEMLAGTADFCPVPLITKSGQFIQVETRVYPGSWNSQPSLFGVTKDITQRKQAENGKRQVIAEIERMNQLMTGREVRIIEMKKEVNSLLAELGREPEYKSVLEETEAVVSSDKAG